MIGLALKIVGFLVLYELVRFWLVRRLRRYSHERAAAFVRAHRIKLESARFIDRVWIREKLAQDPIIDQAVAEAGKRTGESTVVLRDRVDRYAEEIAPYFSMAAYYRFGLGVAKRIINFLFEVVVDPNGFDEQRDKVDKKAVRVYVINHRANLDPAILAYGLLHHVPMSYAVGEWALVWPLDGIFRAFGSYFVRRGEPDPLYHTVLERFIQTIASHGAVTGFFIEGGLTRDGALRTPKTGLLGYLIRLRREDPDREIVFCPVGLNYDRVLEDRILTEDRPDKRPPTRLESLQNLTELLVRIPQLIVANVWRVALRSHQKFGYAAVHFGEPLHLSDWPGGNEIHALDPEAAKEPLAALAEELLVNRIGRAIPATPVPIFCTALEREGTNDHVSLTLRTRQILAELRQVQAPVALGSDLTSDAGPAIHPDFDADLDATVEAQDVNERAIMLLLRRGLIRSVLTPSGPGFDTAEGTERIVSYYSNSIAHHLDRLDKPATDRVSATN